MHSAAETLESGNADLALGYFPDLHRAGFYQQRLFDAHLVCMVRRKHPILDNGGKSNNSGKGDATITLKQYLAASHVLVRPDGREHVFDQVLQQRGLKRRVVLEISHYMSLLPIIAGSDLVATVPQDLAEFCARHADIRLLSPPIKTPAVQVHQFWHSRSHKDAANMWLRGLLHTLFGG